jgi:hypothetical protein
LINPYEDDKKTMWRRVMREAKELTNRTMVDSEAQARYVTSTKALIALPSLGDMPGGLPLSPAGVLVFGAGSYC